ncbi:MAG: SCO family protein [Gammaproteobacteria bacterium]|nr:SCO family protein [Gammaproteobacteria bacterium]
MLPDRVVTVLPTPKPLTDFTLVDHQRRPFTLKNFTGKWSFVFFGFSHCMDACPTTLAALAQVRADLAKQGGDADVQFIFVSVDPDRDSIDKLAQYASLFDASFIGVTGVDAQLRQLAGQLGASFQATHAAGAENYPVIHSMEVFLLDPQARYRAVFRPPYEPAEISSRFRVLRELDVGSTK